jgi:predicted esterase
MAVNCIIMNSSWALREYALRAVVILLEHFKWACLFPVTTHYMSLSMPNLPQHFLSSATPSINQLEAHDLNIVCHSLTMVQSTEQAGPRQRFGVFPPPLIVPPLRLPHTQTFVLLHGRGSSAAKFGPLLLSTAIGPDGSTFQDSFPNARFVFPVAARSRATIYRRSIIRQWYDGSGDWEPGARGGMRETVQYVHGIVRDEVGVVGAENVVLGGLSQGCAMGLLSMLTFADAPLAAVIGMCGFLPYTRELRGILEVKEKTGDETEGGVIFEDDVFERAPSDGGSSALSPAHQAMAYLYDDLELEPQLSDGEVLFHANPVFLGHGTEDEKVGIEYGRATAKLLEHLGIEVQFRSYNGLGHWFSEAMVRDLAAFVKDKLAKP